jgi:hypothetical protein
MANAREERGLPSRVDKLLDRFIPSDGTGSPEQPASTDH